MTPPQLCLTAGAATAVFVVGLLVAHQREAKAWFWVWKPLASLTFVGLALLLPVADASYALWIRIGLVASVVGDLAMIRQGKAGLPLGLGAFLLAHLAYCVALGPRLPLVWLSVLPAVVALSLGGWVFVVIRPHLGKLLMPAAFYTVAVSATCALAVAVWLEEPSGLAGSLIGLGGLLFYVSDVSVARQRFLDTGVRDKVWGLPCYYAGQLLLAASLAAPLG